MVTHGILHHKVVMVPHASIISENEVSSTVPRLLCSHHSTNQELLEKYNCIKVATAVVSPSENMYAPHLINEWMGGRYFLSNGSSEGFQKVTEC